MRRYISEVNRISADAAEALRWFFENSERMESSNSKAAGSYISETASKELHKQYGELVDALFEQILSKNLPVEAFYKKCGRLSQHLLLLIMTMQEYLHFTIFG